MTTTTCNEQVTHCESCGSTNPEDVDMFTNDGYSLCCNELIRTNYHGDRCKGHHLNLNGDR